MDEMPSLDNTSEQPSIPEDVKALFDQLIGEGYTIDPNKVLSDDEGVYQVEAILVNKGEGWRGEYMYIRENENAGTRSVDTMVSVLYYRDDSDKPSGAFELARKTDGNWKNLQTGEYMEI